jgi:hypothetical protein
VSVTADAQTKAYGDADPALTYTVAPPLVGSDSVSGLLTRVAGEDVGSYAIQAGTLTAGPNYDVTFVGASLTIERRMLTVTATGVDKVYDGTTDASVMLHTNAIGEDTVDASHASANFDSKSVGVDKDVSVLGISISGPASGNYTLANTTAAATATISPKPLVGTFSATSKVYDGSTAATVASKSLAGVVNGDAVSLTVTAAQFDTRAAAAGKTVTANLSIGGADATNYTVNGTATATADVTPLTITGSITVASKTYDGTTAAVITGRFLQGVIGADSVTYVAGTAAFDTKHAGINKLVTATGLGVSGIDAGNYLVNTTATAFASIAPKGIVGQITVADKIYDGSTAATIVARTLDGVLAGDDVAYVGGSALFSDPRVGLAKPVTASGLALSGSDRNNYLVNTTASTTANITYTTIAGKVFLQPLNLTAPRSSFKSGSTIPVKFQLFMADGVTPVPDAVARIAVAMLATSVTTSVNEDVIVLAADAGTTFRYDASGRQYIFNLSTKGWATGTYRLMAHLDDGTTIEAYAEVRTK